jgi:PAS domain S-box-containing protein
MNMVVSGAALLLASVGFFFYDFQSFKSDSLRHLYAEANIIGSNSISALTFGDPDSANKTLSALRASPTIIYAAIYGPSGSLFAEFNPKHIADIKPPGNNTIEAYTFEKDRFLVSKPVVFQNQTIGSVLILSDASELNDRVQRYAGIIAVIFSGALLAALLVSRGAQRQIAQPMMALAETAQAVSQGRDYALRVDGVGAHDEVSTVIEAFNRMLEQIQVRDRELRAAHDTLERKVKARTAQLEKRTEQVAEQAQLLDLANDAIFVRTADNRISYWNRGAERLYGWSREEAMTRSPHELLRTEFPIALEELMLLDHWEGELRQHRRDGSKISVASRWTTLRDKTGAFAGWLEICSDITARKLAEEAARQLSGRILSMQDDERRRIARELHDSLGQYLAALKINIEIMRDSVSNNGNAGDSNMAQIFSASEALLRQAISETRTISHLLHPPLLDEVGLVSAMNWYIEGFAQRSGIEANVSLMPQHERLSHEIEITLFRILQEALTNVHRHSGSNRVDISLENTNENALLRVRDYGSGIPPERLGHGHHGSMQVGVGLAGMQERVRQLGGSLEICSSPAGTTISVSVPTTAASRNTPLQDGLQQSTSIA